MEISYLIKERRCLNCKEKGYTIHNFPQKAKISVITDASNIDDIENID